ncbi:MAG: fibronectin type III domain-containing protein [Bacteroidota bacterium]|nr:fibronectin type III domain-containing protein [Bacteroidota bacterium]
MRTQVKVLSCFFVFFLVLCGCKETSNPANSNSTSSAAQLTITDITTSTTGSSFTVSWKTNKPARSQVDYGTTINYGTTSPLDSAFAVIHSVTIYGLQASCDYHVRVRSIDTSQQVALSADVVCKTLAANYDYCPYFEKSMWQFAVVRKSQTNVTNPSVTTYGTLSITVIDVDSITGIAKVEMMSDMTSNSIAYVRKNGKKVELSSSRTSWELLFDQDMLSTGFKFLFAGDVTKPSGIVGSVTSTYLTTTNGIQKKKHVDSYGSSYSSYNYENDVTETINKDLGIVAARMYLYDASIGYPYLVSNTLTYTLTAYKIYLPDGTIRQGGTLTLENPPAAPENLSAVRATVLNSVVVTWDDKSFNETGFEIERKTLGTISSVYALLKTVSSNTKQYVDLSVDSMKSYSYRIRAVNSYGESAYSNEDSVDRFGIPIAPSSLRGSYNSNLQTVNLFWNDNSTNETHFQISYSADGIQWEDLSFTTAKNSTSVTLKWDTGPPKGTHYFRIRAVSSYGESANSNVVSVTIP